MTNSIFRAGLMQDEVVVVTGGGTGIGYAVSAELGSLGARLAICGRRPEVLIEAERSLGERGIEVMQRPCDIRDPDSVGGFVEAVIERYGRADVLVNNAGGQFPSPAQHISPRGFEAVVRNNLLGTWNMIHAFGNQVFLPRKAGRIVNVIAEIARGFPGMAHTGVARAGVENLTKTLAVEWAMHGVRVNAVAPGVIETSGTKQYPPELLTTAKAATPLKRLGGAEEVAHLIVYLCSRYADFITGQTFTIDGGMSLWGDQWPIPDDVPQRPPH